MLSTLVYAAKLKTNPAQVLTRMVRRGISVQVTRTHFRGFPRTVSVLMKVIPEEHFARIARSQEGR